jgi:outer membrane protein assembly factor BamB
MRHLLPTIRRAATAALALFVIVSAGPLLGVEHWTSYRGPTGQGRADDANLPLEWSEGKNITWKIPLDGKAWSSPVIWGERIFLTNAPPDGSSLSIVCIDKRDGKILYKKHLLTVPLPQYCHPFNSYASPSPVVEEGRVYVSFGSTYNACLDSTTGDAVWERTDFICNHFRGPGSSMLIANDQLFLHFDGSDHQFVVALDKHTGKTLWRTERTVDYDDINPKTGKPDREGDWRKAFSTPVIMDVDGRPILISLGSMALYGYAADSGKELWRVEFVGSHSGACRPVLGNGIIFAPMGSREELWAVRPDGRGVVTDTHVLWKQKRAVPRRPSLLLLGDLLFMVNDAGVAACVEADTGKEVWRKRIGGEFSASPIYANGRIYCFDQEGTATILKADRNYEVLATNRLDQGLMASPAVSGDALFLRSRTHLYRIEEQAPGKQD